MSTKPLALARAADILTRWVDRSVKRSFEGGIGSSKQAGSDLALTDKSHTASSQRKKKKIRHTHRKWGEGRTRRRLSYD